MFESLTSGMLSLIYEPGNFLDLDFYTLTFIFIP